MKTEEKQNIINDKSQNIFKNMEDIDQNTLDLVNGFIKKSQILLPHKLNTFYIIPKLVLFTILSYYHEMEYFDKNLCGPIFKITNENKTINNINNTDYGYKTCYGAKIISSMLNKTYIWTIKNNETQTGGLCIGIDNAGAKWKDTDFDSKKEKASYAYNGCNGALYGWNHDRKSGYPMFRVKNDILIMKLQFVKNNNKGILSYKVNDDKEFITHQDIPRENELNYRFAISAATEPKIKITLQDFVILSS